MLLLLIKKTWLLNHKKLLFENIHLTLLEDLSINV